jgi:hypothetical protein
MEVCSAFPCEAITNAVAIIRDWSKTSSDTTRNKETYVKKGISTERMPFNTDKEDCLPDCHLLATHRTCDVGFDWSKVSKGSVIEKLRKEHQEPRSLSDT